MRPPTLLLPAVPNARAAGALAALLALALAPASGRVLGAQVGAHVGAQAAPGRLAARPTPAAVAPAAKRRPDYLPFRFEERWPAAPLAGRDPFDPLKHVALTPGGGSYLTLSGQLRWREEAVDHFQLGAGTARNDAYAVTRTALGADLHLGPYVRAYGELRDAVATGRTLPGGARPQDTDRWDVQNAFVELAAPARAAGVPLARALGGLRVRGGRQEVALGRERLVGPGDWSNARRSFQGVRAMLQPTARTAVELLRVRPVVLTPGAGNPADSANLLWGAVATRTLPRRASVQLLTLVLDQAAVTPAAAGRDSAAAGTRRRVTLGGRVTGPLPLGAPAWLSAEFEGGAQRGHLGARRIAAWYYVAELTAAGAKLPLRPTLAVGYDQTSGDRDPADRSSGTFDPLYPTAHSFSGYADVVGRRNLAEARLVATGQLPAVGALRLGLHDFRRVRAADAAYTKSGGVLRAAGGDAARAVGDEVDLTATRPLGAHLKTVAGGAYFAPGAFLRHGSATHDAAAWGFGGLTFTF